jgi:hypothetical protein
MYWTKGDTPHERMERISLAYEFLRKHRGAKNVPSFVKQTSQGTLVNKAFPEISNRGQDRSDGRMEFFNLSSEILRALSGQEVTLEQVYTRALLVDAKFTYSSVLEARLKEHTGGWIPNVLELEYDPDQDPYSKLSVSERLMRGLM